MNEIGHTIFTSHTIHISGVNNIPLGESNMSGYSERKINETFSSASNFLNKMCVNLIWISMTQVAGLTGPLDVLHCS